MFVSQRSNSHINIDDVKIFTTPRKLIRSLQDLDDNEIGSSEKHPRRLRSPVVSKLAWSPVSMHGENNTEELHGNSESVSSTEEVSNLAEVVAPIDKPQVKKHQNSAKLVVFCSLFVGLLAVFLFLFVIGGQDDHYVIVPT